MTGRTVHDDSPRPDDTRLNRVMESIVFGACAAMAFALVWIVHWAIQGTAAKAVSGIPLLLLLFDDLLIATGILFAFRAVGIWIPQHALWASFTEHVGRHVAIAGTFLSVLIVVVILTGILYALGII